MLLSALIEGYLFFTGEIGWPTRFIFGLVGAELLIPHRETVWLILGIAVVIGLILWTRRPHEKPPPVIEQAESDNKKQQK